MALSHSPQIVTDGLAFYYDMNNPQKSFRGAPTTNFLTVPLSPQNWRHQRNSSFGFISDEYFTYNGPLGTNIPAYRRTVSGTDYRAVRFDVPWTAHTQSNLTLPLTGSIYGRCLSPTSNTVLNINFQGTNSSGARVDTNASLQVTDEWTLFSDTRTLSSNSFTSLVNFGMKYYMNGDATQRTWEFMMPQVEQQSFVTPFVNGTRSNTESIIDLTKNNTVTANSLTYDADGSFGFNGTTDFASFGNGALINSIGGTSSITVEAWVRYNSYVGSGGSRTYSVVTHKGSPWTWLMENPSNRGRIRFTIGGADVNCSDPDVHPLNTWMNWVGTYDGANMRFFRNGILKNTVARTGTLGSNSINAQIGQYSNDYRMNGDIGILKIHNRALSAQEVQQNFNALRGRYGI